MTPLPHPFGIPPYPANTAGFAHRARVIGLSTAHNSPHIDFPAQIKAYVGASLVEIKPERNVIRQRGGGSRQQVTDFSKHSRKRLLRLLATIDKSASLPLFVTLTYPAIFPTARESKKHLDNFLKRLARAYPTVSAIWRLEMQSRGAPHYHLLVWGVGFIPFERVARWWYDVVNSGDGKHLLAGTQVKRVRSWRGVWSYASKYMAKPLDTPEGDTWFKPGRFWGIHNRACLPTVEPIIATISQTTYYTMRRYMLRYRARKQSRGTPTTERLFMDAPHRMFAAALRTDTESHVTDWTG
jgi:hypothetical protein